MLENIFGCPDVFGHDCVSCMFGGGHIAIFLGKNTRVVEKENNEDLCDAKEQN